MENQNLTEKHLKQEQELKELRRSENMEEQYVQLAKELNIGLCDLQALVKICLERANGQDPNLAALLGIRGNSNFWQFLRQKLRLLSTVYTRVQVEV